MKNHTDDIVTRDGDHKTYVLIKTTCNLTGWFPVGYYDKQAQSIVVSKDSETKNVHIERYNQGLVRLSRLGKLA